MSAPGPPHGGLGGGGGGGGGKPKGAAGGPAKKLVIKPLKLKPQLPDNFEETSWAKLSAAVAAVHAKRPVAAGLEELYRAVEDLCLHKMAASLYERLQRQCDEHVARAVAALQAQAALEPVAFLDRADAAWRDYCESMLTVRSIFLYLDRSYVISALPGMRSLFDMGLASLRHHLGAAPDVERRIVRGLLSLIERERGGEAVDRQLLGRLLRMLQDLGLYAAAFQPPFLSESAAFYAAEGEALMSSVDVPDYLAAAEARLTQEAERCRSYLDASTTRAPLIGAVEAALLTRHLPAVLERGFADLVSGHRLPDLARLYALTGRVGGHDALRAAWREHVAAAGGRIVRDEEKDKEMVERLLELKRRLDEVLRLAFQRSEPFAASLKDALESAVNCRQNKPAELVAKYIDARLRAGGASKGLADDELEAALDAALALFRYVQGKDVFEAFYKKDLAKRLLLGKSASVDAEKSMIGKLKAECGNQFTANLEGMFRDMELSKEFMAGFRTAAAAASGGGGSSSGGGAAGTTAATARGSSGGGNNAAAAAAATAAAAAAAAAVAAAGGVDASISVLTSGFWPTYPVLDVALPEPLGTLQQAFTAYYLARQGGRQLVWQHSLGSCLLRACFPRGGTKELSVSTFQAVVLMLFNEADALSLSEVAAQSGLEDRELRRTLQSLACGKTRVLKKVPAGRDVGDGDVFEFNAAFTDRLIRIKINSIQMKETLEENTKTNEQVLQDRQYQIDAAIVRVMKARKALSHKLLVQEVLTQLKFPLRGADLKRRIDSLIEREFLERSAADAGVYEYLA